MTGDVCRFSTRCIGANSLLSQALVKICLRILKYSWLPLLVITLQGCATSPVETVAEEPVFQKTDNELLIGIAEGHGLVADESERGVHIYLPKLTFEYNSIELSSEAERKIYFIALILNSHLAIGRGVVLSGHADSLGAPGNNLKVSKLRALETAERLVNHGVDPNRLDQEWHGDKKPIIPNQLADGSDNPEGRALNRRVEIIILNP